MPSMKAHTLAAQCTPELAGLPVIKKRGRPATGKALTPAERQSRYRRHRQFIDTGERMRLTIKRLAEQFDLSESDITRALLRFALCNRNWAQTGFASLPEKKQAPYGAHVLLRCRQSCLD